VYVCAVAGWIGGRGADLVNELLSVFGILPTKMAGQPQAYSRGGEPSGSSAASSISARVGSSMWFAGMIAGGIPGFHMAIVSRSRNVG